MRPHAPSLRRLRAVHFGSPADAAITVGLALALGLIASLVLRWALIDAVWQVPAGDSAPCRAAQGHGACWAVVGEKLRFVLFATYPYDQHWRPAGACLVLVALYGASAGRRMRVRPLIALWAAGLTIVGLLMGGGAPGLPPVAQERWGGLPVTLLLATIGIAAALPLGVLLALGRRARGLPVIRVLCVICIELIRGVPLISLLFMASVMVPLFLPSGLTLDKLLRAQLAIILFAAAYVAEVVRGGLQGVPRGQAEAAQALGLGYWRAMALVILPQALRHALPALVNTFITLLKDTSLVLIIGIFDLLSAAKAATVDPLWQGFGLELFLAVSLIYFGLCLAMSRYARGLEAGRQTDPSPAPWSAR